MVKTQFLYCLEGTQDETTPGYLSDSTEPEGNSIVYTISVYFIIHACFVIVVAF